MSYPGLLKHKCSLLKLSMTMEAGLAKSQWVEVARNVPCFLDLNFIRRGKDPLWTAEAGRPSDRSGVLFLKANSGVESGMRVRMSFGPSGTFLIEGAVDEAWRPTRNHHIEVGVSEVPSQISAGKGAK